MKLSAKITSHSSIVGGGLVLCDQDGCARFVVNFIGTGWGITKEQSDALASQFAYYVNNHDVVVPESDCQ